MRVPDPHDFCFDYLPRLTGSHSAYETVMAQLAGECKGYFLLGENPAVGSANAKLQRLGMANLDWLVVRDFSLVESATFWKDGPEIETGELRTEDIGTEVFFLPAAAHTEKSGSFTDTQRLLQWHHAASERMERRIGMAAEPYAKGRGGRYIKIGKALAAAGAAGALLGQRSRAVAALSGAALIAASAATRWGIYHAGMASSADPKYTVVPQRQRLNEQAAAERSETIPVTVSAGRDQQEGSG